MLENKIGRICFARLAEGDDLLEAIAAQAKQGKIKTGCFTLIGALRKAVVGCYKKGSYTNTSLEGPMEIASCMGNIALDDKGETVIHAHMVVTKENGQAFGGHLMKGSIIEPMAELMIIEGLGADLRRIPDEKTKLKLLDLH